MADSTGDLGRARNPFAEAWRDCLLAHYEYVIMERDMANEASLRSVLLSIGVEEETLYSVYHAANGDPGYWPEAQPEGVGSVPDPFGPEPEKVTAQPEGAADVVAEPPAESVAEVATTVEVEAQAVGLEAEPEVEPEPPPPTDPEEPDEPPPTQLSLF